jgi:23S rRNA pseudouridine1911/1915/1917 synthase
MDLLALDEPQISFDDPSIDESQDEGGSFRRLGAPVPPQAAGERVDAYLAKHFRFLSRSRWQKRIAEGELFVNDRSTRVASRLKAGDRLTMYSPLLVEPDVDRSVRCLWEGDGVMAIYKPGHLPMHENGPYRKNTFTHIVWDLFGREWSAVHRLDRETSGIVLCGGTSRVRAKLSRDFETRLVEKEYLAIARGKATAPHWTAHGPIGDLVKSAIRIKRWVVPGGLHAETGFEVLDELPNAVLLKARPKTGRTNQIRIHAAHGGLPLYGDKLYHDDEAVFLEFFEQGPTPNVVARAGFSRVCLHAYALTFVHPVTGERVRVECPLPPDLAAFWDHLKEQNFPPHDS